MYPPQGKYFNSFLSLFLGVLFFLLLALVFAQFFLFILRFFLFLNFYVFGSPFFFFSLQFFLIFSYFFFSFPEQMGNREFLQLLENSLIFSLFASPFFFFSLQFLLNSSYFFSPVIRVGGHFLILITATGQLLEFLRLLFSSFRSSFC